VTGQGNPSYTLLFIITCGCIAVVSVVLALAEAPTWQALIAFVLMIVTTVIAGYSLWRLKKDII
jgi:uncharacterized membrane protein